MKEELAEKMYYWVLNKGFNPFYVITVICILIYLFNWKDIKNWE